MVAGGVPTFQVLLDDGTNTFPYDITAFVRLTDGITISRGRDDEQSDVTAGQCSFTLDNTDGRFTLGSTIIATPSPITVDNRVRVKYQPNVTVFNRHTGNLASIPVAWPTGGDQESRVAVVCVDDQAQAQRRPLRSVPEEEIMADQPDAYYVLNEPAGSTTAAESSGNQNGSMTTFGSGTGFAFGATTGPTTDGYTALQVNGGTYLASTNPNGIVTDTVAEAAFVRTGNPSVTEGIIPDRNGDGKFYLTMNTSGHLVAGTYVSLNSYADGKLHYVSVLPGSGGLYIDGNIDGSIGVPGPPVAATPMTGTLAHVVYYYSSLTASDSARILARATAVLTGFAGETDTARITRLAGYASVPLGTLDASRTNVGFTDTTGNSDWDAIKQVADAGMGVSYINGSGGLDYHSRNKAVAKTSPDVTFAAEFLAEDTSFMTDTQNVVNYMDTTSLATGVTQVVRNTVSELGNGTATHPGHGRYPASASYLVTTDAEALDRANWIVSNHAEPAPRAGRLTLDLLTMTKAQQETAMGIEADTWLRITGLPSQSPTGTTGDFIVQGIAADSMSLTAWTLTLNVVSRSLFSPVWILDDTTYSVLDTTTRLFV